MSTSSATSPNEAIVDDFISALEKGSVDGVLACYTPDARIWHNFDQLAMSPEESLGSTRTLFANFVSRSYVDIRRHITSTSLVQQHLLRLGTADGRIIDWPGCIVFKFRNGLISRLDEYIDIASLSRAG